ncbi:MAG: methionine--tRNA ligase [Clostridia bacterium]|nr:methionine--tRNA ligase [Clostridia bacterium]
MSKAYYVTTPIYYPSDRLHIGHALTTTMADTLARWKRMQGYDVFFLTGSDEHGLKIERKAREQGTTPQEYVDRIVATFKQLWQKLLISYDDFIRTTEERHIRVVQQIFQKIYDQGDIYKSEYEGWYCAQCEAFYTPTQVKEFEGGLCPDHGIPVEWIKEESYFFRLSRYADRLLQYIEDHPHFIQPESRRNEMVSFIKSGLEDLCVSRTTFDWGIPVPTDPKHVIYVWIDALTNYISALGYGSGDPKFEKFWPEAHHLVGKDIVRFHTVIWPIILMAAGIEPPKEVFGHGWLLVEGGKMSKTKGNVVDPMVLIDKYGVDAIRYFLLREMPYGEDGVYSEEALVRRTNTDLANDLGNLISRSLAMIERFAGGVVPEPGPEEEADRELRELAQSLPQAVDVALDRYEFAAALAAIWKLVARANKYIEDMAPWSLAKRAGAGGSAAGATGKGADNGAAAGTEDAAWARQRLNRVLYNLAETIRVVTVLASPFMPAMPDRVWPQLGIEGSPELASWESIQRWGALPPGTRVHRGEAVFPRIGEQGDAAVAEEQGAKNQLRQTAPKEGKRHKEHKEQLEKKEAARVTEPETELISIEEFARLDLRVAEVLAAEKVEKTDRLLKLRVRIGDEERTVVAGIAQYYRPEELVGKKVVVVANLKPATLRGITSQGMILAAVGDDGLSLVTPERNLASGAKVR